MRAQLLSVITFCLVLNLNLTSECNVASQKIKRDLATYDKAGPYNFDNDLHPRDAEKLLGELREFLWKHWREQRLGVVTATFHTLEGDQTMSCYFVESDAKGTWRIRVDSESIISALLPKGKKPRRERAHDDYDKVDRVEPTIIGPADAVSIRDDELREPHTFKLRLKNSKTNSVRIL